MKAFQSISRKHVLTAAAVLVGIGGAANAQVWIGPAGAVATPKTGLWDVNANWAGGVKPVSANNTALTFSNPATNAAYTSTNDVPAPPFVLNSLTLDNKNGGACFLKGTALDFQVDPAGPTAPSLNQLGNFEFRVENPLVINAGLDVRGAGTGFMDMRGVISGTGAIDVNMSGRIGMVAKNTYTGGTTLTSGLLGVAHADSSLGTGKVTLAGGVITGYDNTKDITINNDVDITGDFQAGSPTTNRKMFFNGNATIAGVRNITVKANANTSAVVFNKIDETAAGAAGITKLGNGTLQLSSDSKITGALTVKEGAMVLKGSLGSATNKLSGVTVDGNDAKLVMGQNVAGMNPFRKLHSVDVVKTKNAATVRIGQSPGVYGVEAPLMSFDPGTTFEFDADGNTPGNSLNNHSRLDLVGALELNSTSLNVNLGYSPSPSDKLFLVTNDGSDSILGTFAQGSSVTLTSTFDGVPYQFDIGYQGNWLGDSFISPISGGNDIVLYNATAVPEPALLSAAGVVLNLLRRRRN